jgi:hypothetical protein
MSSGIYICDYRQHEREKDEEEGEFKTLYNGHTSSFRNSRYKHATEHEENMSGI